MNRYDIVYLFDVKDGNPNGDPDAGNLPRVDPETSHGLVTDVCLKRKIRNYVEVAKGGQPPFEIYFKEKGVLNQEHERAYLALDIKPEKKKLPKDKAQAQHITKWMCQNFFDIRTFGAVMTTEVNCGQVRGPWQITLARSIDPVYAQEHAITRTSVTNVKDLDKERTMGRKFTIPYGLYRVHLYYNPFLAEQTTFNTNNQDLEIIKDALNNMFEMDRSASRGAMAPQACVAFKHESKLGNARADELFKRVTVDRVNNEAHPPRDMSDYNVKIDDQDLPTGVSIERWV